MTRRTPPPEKEPEPENPEIQELRRIVAQQQQAIQQPQFSHNQRPQNPGMAVLTERTIGNYNTFFN